MQSLLGERELYHMERFCVKLSHNLYPKRSHFIALILSYNVCPYVARRTVCRDENGKSTSHALPYQFVVPYVMSNDSPAVCPQDPHNGERNLSVLVVVAVGLLIAQSDARHSPPCCIVSIASYSNFRGLMVKRNIK